MSVRIIQERLDAYQCQTAQAEENALREITQEVILAALSRTDFFKKSAFQGGTALRILYSLQRFSEDLDFVLKEPRTAFQLKPYLDLMSLELQAYGYEFEIVDREQASSAVKKAFLKDDSLVKVVRLKYLKSDRSQRHLKIKIEVDANPPAGSHFKLHYLTFPFSYAVTAQDMPSLFAGKSHALLCREYLKGRDWYDFIWYVSRKTPVNFDVLSSALNQQGPWRNQRLNVNLQWYVAQIKKKIEATNWPQARDDVMPFVKPGEQSSLDVWSADFFMDCLQKWQANLNQSIE